MRRIIFIFLFLLPSLVFAQPGVAPVISKEGNKYYNHLVEDGHTLWGLQTMYGVPYQEIVDANQPFDGLKRGSYVLVPIKEEVKEQTTSEYKVKSGETLYGLSKKFDTSIDQLIELNPELSSDGLRKGQVIIVPGEYKDAETNVESNRAETQIESSTPNPFVIDTVQTTGHQDVVITFSDSTVDHVVMSHETMYSISKRYMVSIDEIVKRNKLQSTSLKTGQVLIIPVKNERVDKVEVKRVPDPEILADGKRPEYGSKEEYRVALFLPFYLEFGQGYSENISNLATQYYMGTMMAIDSLEKKGLKAKLFVYDTKNDSATIERILAKPEMNSLDLILGPLMESHMGQVAHFAKKKGIRMVCPVPSDISILKANPYVYASVPSNITLIKGMAKFLIENCQTGNIILVKPLDEASMPMYEAFRKAYKEYPVQGSRPALIEATIESFNTYLKKGRENHLILPTSHRSSVVKFVNNVNRSSFRAHKDDIFIYGTRDWVNFSEVNDVYKNKYNYRFPSPNHLDYFTDQMIELNKKYREVYKTDMSKVAVQAYDIMMYFSSNFFLDVKVFQMMNDFNELPVYDSDGYENKTVFMIEQEEYELTLIKKVLAD